MTSVCFYFEVHQPYLIPEYSFFDNRNKHNYEDNKKNVKTINAVADNYYLPTNKKLDQWCNLLNSNHFYRMCSIEFYEESSTEQFNHNEPPYEAYIHFMNIATDLKKTVPIKIQENYKKELLLTTKVA